MTLSLLGKVALTAVPLWISGFIVGKLAGRSPP